MPNSNGTILVVEDEPVNSNMLQRAISSKGYTVFVAMNGQIAVELARQYLPDMILMDITMPEMDGITACQHIKEDPRTEHIPVIFQTALGDVENYERALEVGGEDFLVKPWRLDFLLARIRSCIRAKRTADELREYRRSLEDRVLEQTLELLETQNVTVFSLARLAECRDPETGEHLERIRHTSSLLARSLMQEERYASIVNQTFVESIFRSSVLHDIGKVGIPDSVLLKPGKLTPEEFGVMKNHTTIGGDALSAACHKLRANSFLEMARDIAYSHHERFDGRGYPHGIAGLDIPLPARIVSIVDVFDALMSRRPYKEPFPLDKTLEIMAEGRGTQFDPLIFDIFLHNIDMFNAVRQRFVDG